MYIQPASSPNFKVYCLPLISWIFIFHRTILYVSVIYCIGNLIVSMTSLPPLGAGEIPGPMIGLFLIALGTGGIKPCVSAFGGDQFTSDQSKLLQSFFSVFYFAINAGSLLSMLITPVLRGMCTSVGYILYDENLNIPKHNSCPRMLADFIVTCVYLNK